MCVCVCVCEGGRSKIGRSVKICIQFVDKLKYLVIPNTLLRRHLL